MASTKYTIKNIQEMVKKTKIFCTVCKKPLKKIPGEVGINVSSIGAQLYVSGICSKHNNEIQTHYHML